METNVQAGKNAESIFAYSFEAINKGDYTQKVIDNFDHLEKIPQGMFSNSSFHVGAYDYSIKLNQWKITQIKETIDEIEKDSKNLANKYGIKILRDSVVSIVLTVCQPEFLPFNFIIIQFQLNSKKISINNSYRMLSGLLNALEDYWLPFQGRFASVYKKSFAVPTFFQIRYNSKNLKPKLEKIMNDLQKFSQSKINVKKYVESCNELKKLFLLENLENEQISMLKVQNDYYLLGKMARTGSDFATIFALDPNEYSYSGSNPFFGTNSMFGAFPALFLPYLLLVSPIFWWRASHEKIKEYISMINQFKTAYKTEDYLSDDNNEKISEIFDFDNNLNFLLSELNDLEKMHVIFNNHFLESPEILDKSIVMGRYTNEEHKKFENRIKYSYVKICKESFTESIKETKKYVDELKNDLSFIKNRIEFLLKKQDEKTRSNQNTILKWIGVISAIFASIVGIDVIIRVLSGN